MRTQIQSNLPVLKAGLFVLTIVFLPGFTLAQGEFRHATLLSWEGDTKRYMLDRAHNYGGSHYERGLFREQIRNMTAEYELDMLTYQHSAMDDYRWMQQDQGFRLFMGSLNAKYFAVESHLRSIVEVTKTVNFGINGIHLENFRADRFFVDLNLVKTFKNAHKVGVYHTITRDKGDLDAGLFYQYGDITSGMIRVETAFLDWSSNVTERLARDSNMLGRWYEEVYFYDKRPQLFATTLVSPHLQHFRGEIVAGIQTELNKRVHNANGDEFRDREWAHYAAGLLEYYNEFLTMGLTYKRTFSKLLRVPIKDSPYEPKFGNWQFTDQYSVYASGDLTSKLRLEQWVWYEYGTDQMLGEVPQGDRPFNYKEERLKLKTRMLYENQNQGLVTGIEFHADFRYPQSEQELATYRRRYHVQEENSRLTFTLGYRLNPHFHVLCGLSYDIDRDRIVNKTNYAWFDGGFGRLVVTW